MKVYRSPSSNIWKRTLIDSMPSEEFAQQIVDHGSFRFELTQAGSVNRSDCEVKLDHQDLYLLYQKLKNKFEKGV